MPVPMEKYGPSCAAIGAARAARKLRVDEVRVLLRIVECFEMSWRKQFKNVVIEYK